MKRRLLSWINPKLEARKVPGCGNGVFALKACKKDEVLGVFGGYVMTLQEEEELPPGVKDLALQISDKFVIGPSRKSELGPGDYFNHSCDPNAGFDGQLFLVAMRNIKPKEQICFDYAMTIAGNPPYSFECLCGSRRCRKKITNMDWKKLELQKRYRGYFQWYIEKKLRKMTK